MTKKKKIMDEFDTKTFIKVETGEIRKIYFKEGLFGFENYKEFCLDETDGSPFLTLKSWKNKSLAFIVIDPYLFMPDYNLEIDQKYRDLIEISPEETPLCYAIVTLPENPEKMTVNLMGPIIINLEKSLGAQALSLDNQYRVNHSLFREIKKHLDDSQSQQWQKPYYWRFPVLFAMHTGCYPFYNKLVAGLTKIRGK